MALAIQAPPVLARRQQNGAWRSGVAPDVVKECIMRSHMC